MRIRTIKQKKSKEIKSGIKEIKSKQATDSEESEDDFDSGFETSSSFSSNGKKAAPVLDSSGEKQSLEQVASTAPATATPAETNSKYLESNAGTNYADNKYTDKRYDAAVDVNKSTVRAAGGLQTGNMVPINQRTPQTNVRQTGDWGQDRQMMPENKYESINEGMKKRLPFERKRKF